MSGQNYNNRGGNRQARQAPQFDVEREREILLQALSDPQMAQEYRVLLGPDVDYERFKSSAIDAVMQNPKLLNPAPAFRGSLFFSLKKAAKQSLEPDGRQGALIPRYNSDARCELVQWQPMVAGVRLAAKRAGLPKIKAEFVLVGEPFQYISGSEDRIHHEWKIDVRDRAYSLLRQIRKTDADPNAPPDTEGQVAIVRDLDAFWEMIAGGYCIIGGADGTKYPPRVMPRTRLLLLRDAARARGASPWYGPFLDEMIVKSIVHFGCKAVAMESSDPAQLARIKQFRDALDHDMDADFDDDEGRTIEHQVDQARSVAALPSPNMGDKLHRFEDLGGRDDREAVGQQQAQGARQASVGQAAAGQAGQTRQADQDGRQADQAAGGQQQHQSSQAGQDGRSGEDRARQAAEQFARRMIGDIGRADAAELNGMLGGQGVQGNLSIARWMERLKEGFDDLYDSVLRARSTREQELAKKRRRHDRICARLLLVDAGLLRRERCRGRGDPEGRICHSRTNQAGSCGGGGANSLARAHVVRRGRSSGCRLSVSGFTGLRKGSSQQG